MVADRFERLCRTEKDSLVDTFFDPAAESAVGAHIQSLALSDSQLATLRLILDAALTDTMYTMLVALDGGASIGGVQQAYDVRDETGAKITGDGELESAAFEHFHESDT
jgi:hypothetical protein